MLGQIIAVTALLPVGGCLISSYEAIKLNAAGDLGDAKGIPYTLPRTEFIPKPVEGKPGQYELVITPVPDPDQRYSLRTAPAWFADVNFDMKLGDSGSLAEVGATQTERVVSTITAIGNFAVSTLSAAALFADRGSLAGDLQSSIASLCSGKVKLSLERAWTAMLSRTRTIVR